MTIEEARAAYQAAQLDAERARRRFADALHAERERGRTPADIARDLDVNRSTVSRWLAKWPAPATPATPATRGRGRKVAK